MKEFGTAWSTLMTNVYLWIVYLTVPTAIVGVAITSMMVAFSREERDVDKARKWRSRIIKVGIIILLAGFLATSGIAFLKGINSGVGTMPTNQFAQPAG